MEFLDLTMRDFILQFFLPGVMILIVLDIVVLLVGKLINQQKSQNYKE